MAPIIRFKCMACRSTAGVLKVDGRAAMPWVLSNYGAAWLHPYDQQPALCNYCREAWKAQELKEASGASDAQEPKEASGASASALWLAAPRDGPVGSNGASASGVEQADLKEPKATSETSSTWAPRLQPPSRPLRGNKAVGGPWQ